MNRPFTLLFLLFLVLGGCMSSKRIQLFSPKEAVGQMDQYYFYPSKEGISCTYNPDVNWTHFQWTYKEGFQLKVDILTHIAEGEMKGEIGFVFGDVESLYSAEVQTKRYTELIEYTVNSSFANSPRVVSSRSSRNVFTRLFSSLKDDVPQVYTSNLIWNRIEIDLADEDIVQFLEKSDYSIVTYMDNCDFTFTPSSTQRLSIKRFIESSLD